MHNWLAAMGACKIIPFAIMFLNFCFCFFEWAKAWLLLMQNHRQLKDPTSLFEHFLVVGLHSCANVEAIEDAFVKRKAWENGVVKSDVLDLRNIQYHAAIPTLEPQVCTIHIWIATICVSALQMVLVFSSSMFLGEPSTSDWKNQEHQRIDFVCLGAFLPGLSINHSTPRDPTFYVSTLTNSC